MKNTTLLETFFDTERPAKKPLNRLREIMLSTALNEDFKEGVPIYHLQGRNVAALRATENHYQVLFFRGTFLRDEMHLLTDVREDKTNTMRQLQFTEADQLDEQMVKTYVKDAIAKAEPSTIATSEKPSTAIPPLPRELENAFSLSSHLKKRFELLAIDQQNEYIKYIGNGGDQQACSKRLEHCLPFIMRLRGLDDSLKE